jgi:hypothetical protein
MCAPWNSTETLTTMSKKKPPTPAAKPEALFDRVALFSSQRGILRKPWATPWDRPSRQIQALKGRPNRHRPYAAPSGLANTCPAIPRALPWAVIVRPVGAGLIETYLEERNDG